MKTALVTLLISLIASAAQAGDRFILIPTGITYDAAKNTYLAQATVIEPAAAKAKLCWTTITVRPGDNWPVVPMCTHFNEIVDFPGSDRIVPVAGPVNDAGPKEKLLFWTVDPNDGKASFCVVSNQDNLVGNWCKPQG